jgi:hypothetical protein
VSPLIIFDHHHPPHCQGLYLNFVPRHLQQWAVAIANPRGIHINQSQKIRREERRPTGTIKDDSGCRLEWQVMAALNKR